MPGLMRRCSPALATNRPTMDGVVAHVAQVAAVACRSPSLMLRSFGHRSDARGTIARIATIRGVVGVVDATRTDRAPFGDAGENAPEFIQLCGADELMTTFNLNGGAGAVSTVANLLPKNCVWLQQACQAHDWLAAQRIQHDLGEMACALPAFGLSPPRSSPAPSDGPAAIASSPASPRSLCCLKPNIVASGNCFGYGRTGLRPLL